MLQTENSAVTTNQGDFSNNNNNNEDASASKKRQQGSFVRRHLHIGESMLSMSQKKQMLDSSETKEDMAGWRLCIVHSRISQCPEEFWRRTRPSFLAPIVVVMVMEKKLSYYKEGKFPFSSSINQKVANSKDRLC